MNQYCTPEQTIEIHVSARNHEMAEAMGEIVEEQLGRIWLDPRSG